MLDSRFIELSALLRKVTWFSCIMQHVCTALMMMVMMMIMVMMMMMMQFDYFAQFSYFTPSWEQKNMLPWCDVNSKYTF